MKVMEVLAQQWVQVSVRVFIRNQEEAFAAQKTCCNRGASGEKKYDELYAIWKENLVEQNYKNIVNYV